MRPPPILLTSDAGHFQLGAINSSFTGSLLLCYKFEFETQPDVAPTAFVLFPQVRAAIVRIGSVEPRGTAVGCSSNLTLRGAGFSALKGSLEPLRCSFSGLGSTDATLVDDGMVHCMSRVPPMVATYPMRFDVGQLTGAFPDVEPTFGAFDSATSVTTSLLPAGGPYNLEWDVAIEGQFEDWGAPRCRFGSWVGATGTVLNATHAICRKPRFPDTVRDAVGSYPVTFSPNGQCFAASTPASFLTYNSQVNSLHISGAPTTSSISLQIEGEGFVQPAMEGGVCLFTRPANHSMLPDIATTKLVVASTTLAHCQSPASGVAGSWVVQVLQNGLSAEPSLHGDPLFSEYDPAAVSVSAIVPLGIAQGTETTITVHGSSFANYGDGQIVARTGDDLTSPLMPCLLLSSERLECTFFASSWYGQTQLPGRRLATVLALAVSLSGGADGSFSTPGAKIRSFVPPYLASVSPTSGAASGGTLVTLRGTGFTSFDSADEALRTSLLRCKFGDVVQQQPPAWHTDTEVVCNSTWGADGAQPVTLTLNGKTFKTRRSTSVTSPIANESALPHFTFEGLHPPSLVDVYFDTEGTMLVARFDSQPTNRGGMNGLMPCRAVMDEVTVARLQGSGESDVLCDWLDGSSLVAFLSMSTAAAAGMTVSLKAHVLWPQNYGGSCTDAHTKCAPAQHLTVDALFPCDQYMTAERELCAKPVATIQAPTELGSCPGSTLLLDASRSTGGGVRPLSYAWTALPRSCDNYYQVSAVLKSAGSSPSVLLPAWALDGGSSYTVVRAAHGSHARRRRPCAVPHAETLMCTSHCGFLAGAHGEHVSWHHLCFRVTHDHQSGNASAIDCHNGAAFAIVSSGL